MFFSFRQLTVGDFMTSIVAVQETGKMIPPITCKLNTYLGNVIHTLASKSVHRIYVVSEEEEVVGVITLRDVISCFIYEPPNYFENLRFSVKEMLSRQ